MDKLELCRMNLLRLISYCLIGVIIILIPASAVDTNGWTNQTINNEFVVLLPPDWSNFAISSYSGPATGVMDNNEIDNVIGIKISANTNCSEIIQENLEVNLASFNAKSGIANITPEVYGVDNVTEYGKYNDGKIANIFLRIFEGNLISVFGTYETIEDAKEKAEQFKLISKSITPLNPASNDICAAEKNETNAVPTYKPRVIPTVKNTIQPTPTPTG